MFKSFRNPRFMRSTSFLLAASFTIVSCAKNDAESVRPRNAISEVAKDLVNYSGEDLFKGIFLLEGEVSKKLPTLEGMRLFLDKEYARNPKFLQARKQNNQQMVDAIKKINPLYFNTLKESIKSKQFNKISSSLKEGASLLKNIVDSKNKDNSSFKEANNFVESVDRSKFDFTKEKDIEAYISLVKSEKGKLQISNIPSSNIEDEISVIWAFDIAVAIELVAILLIAFVAIIPFTEENEPSSLEYEALVRDIAFKIN